MKIKYRIERWETSVVFQILEMDERFRKERQGTIKSYTATSMHVCSAACPQIATNYIYLRGFKRCDDLKVVLLSFATSEEADRYIKEVHTALREWAYKCPEINNTTLPDVDEVEKNTFVL